MLLAGRSCGKNTSILTLLRVCNEVTVKSLGIQSPTPYCGKIVCLGWYYSECSEIPRPPSKFDGKVKGQTVQAGELRQTHTQTDGRYQVHYFPHFAVDN